MNPLSTLWDRDPSTNPPEVSFEFFPPSDAAAQARLWRALERLAPLAPSFVSVTYGAGGSTRERTHETVIAIRDRLGLRAAAHLTCVDASKTEIESIARRYWRAGVRHIVALRGDAPGASGKFTPPPRGYSNAAELVAGLRRVADFEISVAAHPEGHPDAVSAEADLDNLQRKIDAGAGRAVTQYFFDPDVFLRFRDRVAARGICVPLVPGILPVTNFAQVLKFSRACGASVPHWLSKLFEGLDDDPETRKLVAAHIAGEQCRRLRAEGVHQFHFYTLNRPELTRAICRLLDIRPRRNTRDAARESRPSREATG